MEGECGVQVDGESAVCMCSAVWSAEALPPCSCLQANAASAPAFAIPTPAATCARPPGRLGQPPPGAHDPFRQQPDWGELLAGRAPVCQRTCGHAVDEPGRPSFCSHARRPPHAADHAGGCGHRPGLLLLHPGQCSCVQVGSEAGQAAANHSSSSSGSSRQPATTVLPLSPTDSRLHKPLPPQVVCQLLCVWHHVCQLLCLHIGRSRRVCHLCARPGRPVHLRRVSPGPAGVGCQKGALLFQCHWQRCQQLALLAGNRVCDR